MLRAWCFLGGLGGWEVDLGGGFLVGFFCWGGACGGRRTKATSARAALSSRAHLPQRRVQHAVHVDVDVVGPGGTRAVGPVEADVGRGVRRVEPAVELWDAHCVVFWLAFGSRALRMVAGGARDGRALCWSLRVRAPLFVLTCAARLRGGALCLFVCFCGRRVCFSKRFSVARLRGGGGGGVRDEDESFSKKKRGGRRGEMKERVCECA